ncbi:MAG: PadR family transcriptional regulator [Acidimicrobiales bacterium]
MRTRHGVDPALLVLSSLAGGPKHGYALTQDIETFAGVSLGPGTLYSCLARLESQGLVTPVESHDRRRPYRLTAAGATELRRRLEEARTVTRVGLTRLGGAG